jgi:hypothetical protein
MRYSFFVTDLYLYTVWKLSRFESQVKIFYIYHSKDKESMREEGHALKARILCKIMEIN